MTALGHILGKTVKQFASRPLESAGDAFFAFFGSWTLLWNLFYFANSTFSVTTSAVVFLFVLSPFVVSWKPEENRGSGNDYYRSDTRDRILLVLIVLVGAILALCLHRPDADDRRFLGMSVSLLANTHDPLQTVPGFRIESSSYAITSYESLRAAFSYLTGIPVLYSYYLLVPAAIAAVALLVNCALLREIVGKTWPIGALFLLIVLVAWGDAHRTHANFALVRMFQGKAVLVSAIVPAIFFYFFRYLKSAQGGYYALLLFFVLVSGVGFTRGGIVIGPLVLGLLGLVSLGLKEQKRPHAILILVILVAVPFTVLMWGHYGLVSIGVHTPRGNVDSTTNLEMFHFVAGDGFRGIFILISVALSVYAVRDSQLRQVYRRYIIVFFVMLAFPWTSEILAKYVYNSLSWRWLWMVPFPVIAGLAMAGAFGMARERAGQGAALLMVFAISTVFVTASPVRVISHENYTALGWPDFKIGADEIYLIPFRQTAHVRGNRLYLDGDETGY